MLDKREGIQLYLTEGGHTLESLAENVNRQLKEMGRCIVVVSEGFDVGSLGESHDAFGHIEYGASKLAVAQVVANYLNEHGLAARGQATWQVPGVLQRSTSIYASVVDQQEAYEVGRKAVDIGMREGSGWMATILRKPGSTYQAYYDKVRLEQVANFARHLPETWLTADGLDVTDDFIAYAQPLIGDDWPAIGLAQGRQRFARLQVALIEQKLPAYIPSQWRQDTGG